MNGFILIAVKILALFGAFWLLSDSEEATGFAKFIAFFALLLFVYEFDPEKPKTTAYQVCHDYEYWSVQPEDYTTQYFVTSDWFEDEATHSLEEYCFKIESHFADMD